MKKLLTLPLVLVLLFLSSCGGKKFEKNPLDELIKDMTDVESFTILLYDMDAEGIIFKEYQHQYRIIKEVDSIPTEETTTWMQVPERFFRQNENNMGMEIVSKVDGKVSKQVAPPGFSNYVGNERYGEWRSQGGSSFWHFYGQYAFMSSMFHMMAYPVRRSHYGDYRGSYHGTGRPYYGPRTSGGGYAYGTNSNYNRTTKPRSRWNNNFRSRVRSSTSRSGSRYGGSSPRSRGGGFGK